MSEAETGINSWSLVLHGAGRCYLGLGGWAGLLA